MVAERGGAKGRALRCFPAALVAMALWAAPAVGLSQEWSMEDVSFLAGCWAGTMGSLDMREQWSEAEGGVMLGTTRYIRDGQVVDFEFAMLFEREGVVTL